MTIKSVSFSLTCCIKNITPVAIWWRFIQLYCDYSKFITSIRFKIFNGICCFVSLVGKMHYYILLSKPMQELYIHGNGVVDRQGKRRIIDGQVFKEHKPHILFGIWPCM
jgi:hypothetical protein